MEEVYSLQNTFFFINSTFINVSMHLNFVWYLVNFLRGEKLFSQDSVPNPITKFTESRSADFYCKGINKVLIRI